jgi:hypothetical protein
LKFDRLVQKRFAAQEEVPGGREGAFYWAICGLPGDPVYLLSILHEHKARKVCFWHVLAELRRWRLQGYKPGLHKP